MDKKVFLSVVISQYNELENLKAGVMNKLAGYLEKQSYTWEIVVVDDGSSDGSTDLTPTLNIPNLVYVKAPHRGKAGGLNEAISIAKGEWILTTDTDLSTPPSELEKLLPFCTDFDVIIGSRKNDREKSSAIRKLASFIFSTFRKSLILHSIEDTQCGFKLFKSEPLKKLFPLLAVIRETQNAGWKVTAFDVELLFMFNKAGFKIKEVPVLWRNEDISDTKNRKFIKESLDMVKQILKTVVKNIRGDYNNLKTKN